MLVAFLFRVGRLGDTLLVIPVTLPAGAVIHGAGFSSLFLHPTRYHSGQPILHKNSRTTAARNRQSDTRSFLQELHVSVGVLSHLGDSLAGSALQSLHSVSTPDFSTRLGTKLGGGISKTQNMTDRVFICTPNGT